MLKANSKPVAVDRKRKKIPFAGTFEQYQESKKKPVPGYEAQDPPEEKLFLQTGPNGQPIMAPLPKAKDAKKGQK